MTNSISWLIGQSFSEGQKLDNFLVKQGSYTFFQSSAYTDLYTRNGYKTLSIVGIENGQIVASCNVVVLKENFGPLSGLTARAIITGGPVTTQASYFRDIIIKLKDLIKNEVIYLQIRNVFELSHEKKVILENLGIQYKKHYTILNSLHENPMKNYSSGRRKNIRRAIRDNLNFKQLESFEDIYEAGKLVIETYKRIKLPCPNVDFFSSILAFSQQNKIAIFGTYLNNKLIASRFCMMNQHILYDWYAGHIESFNSYYPNDFLIHHIFEWAQKNEIKTFDFGGAGNNDEEYGVREFKLKFGGQLIEYGRNEIVFQPLKYRLGKFGFSMKKLIFK